MGIVTIYDIAKEAKVSPATVSRVITGNARVNPEKERMIRSLMEKYNFQPNAMAKSLIDGKTRLIGLISADIRNPFYAEVCVACEEAANEYGCRVLLRVIKNHAEESGIQEESLDMFAAHRVDALIQIGIRVDDLAASPEYAKRINGLHMPFVSTGKVEGAAMYTCGIDSEEGLRVAFERLYSLGHRRIALLGGRLKVRSTYEKWAKYIYMLGIHNLPLTQGYVQESDYDFAGGFDCMNRLLDLDEPPTGVIAVNDYSAAGVLSAIARRGLRCPGDISVVSHDNTFLTGMTTPRLTSVDYDYGKLGQSLVSTALRAFNGEDVPRETYLTPTLVERDSCAAPPRPCDKIDTEIDYIQKKPYNMHKWSRQDCE